jgi:hypothetical protein
MDSSAKEAHDLSRKRFQEMSRANDLQEKVVDMDILLKDLSACLLYQSQENHTPENGRG